MAIRNQLVNDGAKTSTYSNGRTTAPKPAVSTTSKSASSSYVSSYKPNTGTTTYKNASTGQNYTAPKDAYTSSKATPQQVKKVYQQYGVIPSDNGGDTGGSRGVSSSGSSGSDVSSSIGSGSYPSAQRDVDDTLEKIKELLSEQQKRQNEYFQEQYNQTLAKNKEEYERNRNQINLNYARGDRFLRSVYGDAVSGQGLSNRARNNSNWQTNLATNLRNYTNNDSTALSNFNMNKANAASQLAQGWYNYVLPVYTNRATNADDFDYRKYLASLNL